MKVKSGAPFITLILSLFALGIIAIESLIPAGLATLILYLFEVKVSLKTYVLLLSLITILRGSFTQQAKFQITIKEE